MYTTGVQISRFLADGAPISWPFHSMTTFMPGIFSFYVAQIVKRPIFFSSSFTTASTSWTTAEHHTRYSGFVDPNSVRCLIYFAAKINKINWLVIEPDAPSPSACSTTQSDPDTSQRQWFVNCVFSCSTDLSIRSTPAVEKVLFIINLTWASVVTVVSCGVPKTTACVSSWLIETRLLAPHASTQS